MTSARTRDLLAPLFGLLCGIALACGDGGEASEDSQGGGCAPGMQVSCPCADGSMGVQVCEPAGGFFMPCMCGGATASDTDAETDSDTADSDSATSGGQPECGNGIAEMGECPAACPQDCPTSDSSDSGGVDDTTGEDSCANEPILVATVPNMPSAWMSGNLMGFAAGQDLCRMAATALAVPNAASVSVCDYEQVLEAEAAGELAVLPANTTAWIHRTTAANVMGVASAPGSGGRCVDWTYSTNHISDGEFVTIGAGGVGTYSLDNDTFYDGVDTTHVQPGLLECGNQMRTILCCNPPCMPQG
jgi:hypothetical protein